MEAAEKAINRASLLSRRHNAKSECGNLTKTGKNETSVSMDMKEIKELKVQQTSLKEDLRTKAEEYIILKQILLEKDDLLSRTQTDLKSKEIRLKIRHDELVQLGKVK